MSFLEIYGVDAGTDLRASQYKAVTIGGTIAANGETTVGLLQNKPGSGEDASLGFMGRSRFVAGAAIAAGAQITIVSNGFAITATSGSTVIGRNGRSAVSSGATGEAMISCNNASTLA